MKKLLLAVAGMVLAFNVSAASSKEYTRVDNPVAGLPAVTEFFSFYCPHCYTFEETFKVPAEIKKSLPEGIKMVKYHVNFLGPLGEEMSKAWAVAVALGVEDKVTDPLFDGIQKKQNIRSLNDIKAVFAQAANIDSVQYDATLNSFMVKAFIGQQAKAAEDLKLTGVPAIYVNGRYAINNGGISAKTQQDYAKEFAKVVNSLLVLR